MTSFPLCSLVAFALAWGEPPVAGHFDGAIEIPGQALEIDVDWTAAGGALGGDLSIPAQGAKDLALVDVAVDGRKLRFKLPGIPGEPSFAGEIAADGADIRGTFTQGGQSFPFHLRKQGAGAKAAKALLEGFGAEVDSARAALGVPGLSIVIVKDGEVVFQGGLGQRDVERGLPATDRTLYAIGSTTKAFTTFVLGQLVAEGKVKWDEPVTKWLPAFAVKDRVASERMTPRDLVTHRSGLPRHDYLWYGAKRTRTEMLSGLALLEPSTDFRTDFQYNNLMFVAAGVLIGSVTGGAWEDAVFARVFEPLGMHRANFSVADSQRDEDFAQPYQEKDGAAARVPFRDISHVGPAGSINACVAELAPWLELHLSGLVGDKKLADASLLDELHRVCMPMTIGAGKDVKVSGYALGWMVDDYRGVRRIHHGGGIDGFTANVCLVPESKLGVVALTNLGATELPELVTRMAIDRAVGLEKRPWAEKGAKELAAAREFAKKAEKDKALVRKEGTAPGHPLADYAGTYEHGAYGQLTAKVDGERLVATLGDLTGPLEHWHYEVFAFAKGAADEVLDGMKVQFITDFDGDVAVARVPLEPAVAPIEYERKPDSKLSDPVALAEFEGTYSLPEADAKVELVGATLMATVPGQPSYALKPTWNDTFQFEKLDGYRLQFVRDSAGAIVEMRFLQPNGVFTAKRKG